MLAIVNALVILGTIFGTILHAVLSLLIKRRARKRAGERVFLRLVLAGALFNFGILASIFIELLLRSRSALLNTGFELVSILALALMPSLLLHNFLLFYRPEWTRGMWTALLYLPSLTMYPTIGELVAYPRADFLGNLSTPKIPFLIWAMAGVFGSSAIAFAMYREAPVGRSASSNRTIGRLLVCVGVLLVAVSITGPYPIPILGDLLRVAALLSPNLLAFVFAYSVFRYNYLGYVMKASLFHTLLASCALSLYFFGIRWIGKHLESRYDVDFRVLEAGLVLALLFAFGPIREMVEQVANRLFFKDIAQSRDRLKGLSNELNAAAIPNLNAMMERVCLTLCEVFSTDSARVVLTVPHYQELPRPGITPILGPKLLETILDRPGTLVGIDEVTSVEVAKLMAQRRISWIIPLTRDARVIGAIVIGQRNVEADLTPDERDLLLILANQITMAVEKQSILEQIIALERKLSETDKLSSLGRLAASVAHEIKNPLSSIKAIIQAAREDEQVREPLSDDLAVVVEEIDRLNETVNRLLNYIRPQMAADRLVPVEGIIDGVVDILRYEAEKRHVNVLKEPAKEGHYIRGRAEDLKSVLFNLVLNGLEAMPDGGQLTVSTRSFRPDPGPRDEEVDEMGGPERPRKWVSIELTDTGCGIAPEDMATLFEPFCTTKEGGTGLGMAIVKQKVDELGGRIHVDSGETGTRFVIELPVLGRA